MISLIFLIFYPLWKRKKLIEKRKKKLLLEFKDTILAMAAAMGAGYAVENALKEAADEVRLLHGTDSLMVKEMEDMIHKIHLNQQVECLLLDLGRRSQLEEIENFAQVFAAAKRSGGELVKIIDRTARIIGESIRVENEIEVLTAAKRYEQKIMNGMPLFLVLYMDLTSPGFFQVLYDTWLGRIIMTGCLIVYVLAVYLAERIIRIKM